MTRALLIGREPTAALNFDYTAEMPYEAVVIGSLTMGQLLHFDLEPVLEALAQGKGVYLYTPGLPDGGKNRPLSAGLASAQRQLKSWGVIFTDGGRRQLITAADAKSLRAAGRQPAPGAVLTPLAREILEGSL